MNYKIAGILALTLIASGCAIGGPAPDERLKDLSDKGNNSSFRINYSLERPGTSLLRGGMDSFQFYSHRGDTLFKASSSIIGGETSVNVYDYREGQSITCTSKTQAFNKTKTVCSISNATTSRYTDVDRYADKSENFSMAYLGEKEFAGRKCSMFGMGIPAKDFESGANISGGANVKMCVDNEKGYVAYQSLNLTDPINTLGQTIKNLYTLKAQEYTEGVTEKEVTPSQGLALSVSCEPLKTDFTSIGYSGNVTVSANGNNSTFSIQDSASKSLNLSEGQVDGENTVKAFYGEKTTEASCKIEGE